LYYGNTNVVSAFFGGLPTVWCGYFTVISFE